MTLWPHKIGYAIGFWAAGKLLDFAFGKAEHHDYVSTTSPRTPPPVYVNQSDPSEIDGPAITRALAYAERARAGR